jgi:glycosyltransferase involved in cell wall biosynthesis
MCGHTNTPNPSCLQGIYKPLQVTIGCLSLSAEELSLLRLQLDRSLEEDEIDGDIGTRSRHLVTIGLPVYNGEKYLRQSIESILNQSHTNLELIVSDNASVDRTQEICEQFANQDSRIRFYTHPVNRGAAFNFNFVLGKARGRFFKWAAHDDICHPRFVEACLDALLANPDAVLAYPTPMDIGESGELLGERDSGLGWDHTDPVERFLRTFKRAHRCLPVFGLTRTSVLKQTCKHGDYPAADRVLIGELSLLGKLLEVPEPLFLHREHPDRFSISHKTIESQIAWFDPSRVSKVNLPKWRMFQEYLAAIRRSPLTVRQKIACRAFMLYWSVRHRTELSKELAEAVRLRLNFDHRV